MNRLYSDSCCSRITHTHTHTHTHTRALTHARTHSHIHSLSHTYTHTLARSHSLTCTHSLTCSRSLTHSHSFTHSHTLSHTHAHTHTHTHAHTLLSLPRSLCCTLSSDWAVCSSLYASLLCRGLWSGSVWVYFCCFWAVWGTCDDVCALQQIRGKDQQCCCLIEENRLKANKSVHNVYFNRTFSIRPQQKHQSTRRKVTFVKRKILQHMRYMIDWSDIDNTFTQEYLKTERPVP